MNLENLKILFRKGNPMERKEIYQAVTEIFAACELNYVKEEVVIQPSLSGLKMFEEPLVKFGSATDELFQKFK